MKICLMLKITKMFLLLLPRKTKGRLYERHSNLHTAEYTQLFESTQFILQITQFEWSFVFHAIVFALSVLKSAR